jgi:hypothetical protein
VFAARKTDSAVPPKKPHESGEHARDLETMIRRSLESALLEPEPAPELQSTSRMSPFDLEDALANPAARPTDAPPPSDGVVEVASLPLPAIEIDRTK